jgi:hypothetical protein
MRKPAGGTAPLRVCVVGIACLRVLGACSARAEAIHHRPRRRSAATAVMHSRQEGPGWFVWPTLEARRYARARERRRGGLGPRSHLSGNSARRERQDRLAVGLDERRARIEAPAAQRVRVRHAHAADRTARLSLPRLPSSGYARRTRRTHVHAHSLRASANVTLQYTVLR